jgi:hypothetical protein
MGLPTSFFLLARSPPYHKKSYMALHGMTYGTTIMYQCTCSLYWTYIHGKTPIQCIILNGLLILEVTRGRRVQMNSSVGCPLTCP